MNIVLNWFNSSFNIPVWQGPVHTSCPYLAPDPCCQDQVSSVFVCYSSNKISRDFSWRCSISTHFWQTSSVGDQYIDAKTRFMREIDLGKLRLLCIQTLLASRTVFCTPIIGVQKVCHVFVRPVGNWEDNVHCNWRCNQFGCCERRAQLMPRHSEL